MSKYLYDMFCMGTYSTYKLYELKKKMCRLMKNENIYITPAHWRPDQRVSIKYSPELEEAMRLYNDAVDQFIEKERGK